MHFLAVGALLFLIFEVVSEKGSAPLDRIEVTADEIERLTDTWARQSGHVPSSNELADIVAAHVREEVLYREAVAMGLHQNDPVIRRLLTQKIAFISEDMMMQRVPTDDQLQAYYQQHQARFMVPAKRSFTHVYFGVSDSIELARTRSILALRELQTTGALQGAGKGDAFALRYVYTRLDQDQLAREFGAEFAENLFNLEQRRWAGPLESSYGLHLVLVTEQVERRLPEFGEIRNKVLGEFRYDLARRTDNAAYDTLKARYEIVIATYPK